MLVVSLLWAVYLFGYVNCFSNSSIYKFQNSSSSSHSYVFVRNNRFVRVVPDKETVNDLGFDDQKLTFVSAEVLASLEKEKPISSMQTPAEWSHRTPDDQMVHGLQKIVPFDPASYWVDSHALDKCSSSILSLPNGKVLIAYESKDSHDLFGFYDLTLHKIELQPNFRVPNSVIYGGEQALKFQNTKLLLKSSNEQDCSILFYFSGVFTSHSQPMVSIGTYNYEQGTIEFTVTKLLEFPCRDKLQGSHWIPFYTHKHELYFIQSLHPMRIVTIGDEIIHHEMLTISNKTSETPKEKRYLRSRQLKTEDKKSTGVPVDKNILSMTTYAYNDYKNEQLPWNGDLYSYQLLGGAPAVLVKGVFLSLFHTEVDFITRGPKRTGFMGAVTFCPHAPFQIHSMSKVPMLKTSFYDGAWASKKVNYALIPTGITLDADKQHIWVTAEWQIKKGYLIKLNVTELLDSLVYVASCPHHSAQQHGHHKINGYFWVKKGSRDVLCFDLCAVVL